MYTHILSEGENYKEHINNTTSYTHNIQHTHNEAACGQVVAGAAARGRQGLLRDERQEVLRLAGFLV